MSQRETAGVPEQRDSVDPDLFIGQIACGVGSPQISGHCFGPNAKVSRTDIKPLAAGAPPGNMLFLLLDFHDQFVVGVGPYLTELAVAQARTDLFSRAVRHR